MCTCTPNRTCPDCARLIDAAETGTWDDGYELPDDACWNEPLDAA